MVGELDGNVSAVVGDRWDMVGPRRAVDETGWCIRLRVSRHTVCR